MPFVHTPDGVNLYYQDSGGNGPAVVLIHGWPASHKVWEPQVAPLVEAGYRVVAYDRRGFGNSSMPWTGYDYDTMAADLKALLDTLNLNDATLVGFSMGGGEVARYIGRYGSDRVGKAVLVSAVTPYLLQTTDNPDGVPMKVFDEMRTGLQKDRLDFLRGFLKDFYGVGLVSQPVSDVLLDYVFSITAHAQPHATYECVAAFAETDFRDDLKAFDVPTLVVHGNADKTVPIEASGDRAGKLVPGARYEVIDGAPHGLNATHTDEFNRILLDFLGGAKTEA